MYNIPNVGSGAYPYMWPLPIRNYENELPAEFRNVLDLDPWDTTYYYDPFLRGIPPWA